VAQVLLPAYGIKTDHPLFKPWINLAALVSKEVAEVRKQKFTRGVFPLLLLGVILLFVFGCKGSDSSSVRIGLSDQTTATTWTMSFNIYGH